ncbi:MAG: hypothetical protein QXT31_03920 [Candidatus Bathyarchaeia archaeon]
MKAIKQSKKSILDFSMRGRLQVSTTNVRDKIRTAIRNAGFDWRPYVLRAYFDTGATYTVIPSKLQEELKLLLW